ncbi:hypothetical protein FOMG_18737 [Fusarium oxysporum f. sp. melonis 26406]|uniref:Uncharacterized protein n=1 Tax=Fusarium oxysporum f. sp. melonis 26406 TaxID=1089452 RepID=W9Z7I3_FUSOX|nr:hypothetical protein FOMG_18737 [Fusarium oxysporum f. sp. melonis 26406]
MSPRLRPTLSQSGSLPSQRQRQKPTRLPSTSGSLPSPSTRPRLLPRLSPSSLIPLTTSPVVATRKARTTRLKRSIPLIRQPQRFMYLPLTWSLLAVVHSDRCCLRQIYDGS